MLAVAGASSAASGSLPGTKTAADRAAWRTILHWPTVCESTWRIAGTDAGAGIVVWPTASGKRLVEVDCSLGAYQGTAMFFLTTTDRHATGPLAFRIYRDPGSGRPRATRATELLGIFDFTPTTGRFVVFDKFRGPGDCGLFSTFRLVGSSFVPTEVRAKVACDGKPPYDPSKWPRLPVPKVP
jgi:uncharacterized protein DUF1176